MIADIVKYEFLQNAYMAGILIALLAPILGLLTVTRKMTFIADALGHINMAGYTFGTLVISTLSFTFFNQMFYVIIWSVFGSILIEYLRKHFKSYKEVPIMIVYSLSIAMTTIFIGLSKSSSSALFNTLFGNINTISRDEVWLIFGIVIICILVFLKFQKDFFILAFEEEVAHLESSNIEFSKYVFMILLAVIISIGIKILGVLLVSSLMIIPILAASVRANSLKKTIIYGIIYAEISIIGGISLSYYLGLSASAFIVLINLAFYLVNGVLKKWKN